MAMNLEHNGAMSFSRIMLGTVQFGLEYGIANESGKPAFECVCDSTAWPSACCTARTTSGICRSLKRWLIKD